MSIKEEVRENLSTANCSFSRPSAANLKSGMVKIKPYVGFHQSAIYVTLEVIDDKNKAHCTSKIGEQECIVQSSQ